MHVVCVCVCVCVRTLGFSTIPWDTPSLDTLSLVYDSVIIMMFDFLPTSSPSCIIQHNYDAILLWYQRLAKMHPHLVSYVESIGKSYLGRDMPAVHLTTSEDSQRKKIYFQCQIHARKCHCLLYIPLILQF